jgi:predicted peptidase
MSFLLTSALSALLLQAPPPPSHPVAPGVHNLTFQTPDGRTMLYAVSIPRGYDAGRPAPLALVLHPGGERTRYYGSAFMRSLTEPALSDLRAVMVAPDCPTNSWTDPGADQAVMALLQDTLAHYAIDRRRVLVTGFSLGGRGTWFMAAHHPDLFTAAIPMAAPTGDDPETLGTMPTYVIHSRADQVVPFAPAEANAQRLAAMGRSVYFEGLYDYGHFEMGRYVDALKRAGRWVTARWGEKR